MEKNMTCLICGSDKRRPVPFDANPEIDAILARRGHRNDYGWALCMTCGNAAPTHQPDRDVLTEYWQTNRTTLSDDAAWAYRYRVAAIGAERSWSTFAPLHTSATPGRFLDIGCGLGATVQRFQNGGWIAFGIDPDNHTKTHHERFGIETRIGQIEDQTWPEPFDLIHIAYAIYFVTDPAGYLRRMRDQLAPGGTLAIVMADLLESNQRGGPSYLHTFLPTAQSLQVALAHAGFTTVLCKKVKDSYFIAAVVGQSVPPKVNTAQILLRHKTRGLRWRMIGAPRAKLRGWIAPLLGR
jgi:SAM-dependent methyltransferase